MGPELPAAAANLANKALRASMSASRDKELADSNLRPQNCQALAVPRVNQEVWKVLQRKTKEGDVTWQKIQGYIHKGMIPLLTALSSLKEKKDKENLQRLLDAFQLFAMGSYSLTINRRQLMSGDLFGQYRQLCAPNKPFTELLFGEDSDLEKELKKLKEAESAATRLGYGPTPMRGNPRGRGKFGGRGRGYRGSNHQGKGRGQAHFLANKAPHHSRRGGHSRGGRGQHQRQSSAAPSQEAK